MLTNVLTLLFSSVIPALTASDPSLNCLDALTILSILLCNSLMLLYKLFTSLNTFKLLSSNASVVATEYIGFNSKLSVS